MSTQSLSSHATAGRQQFGKATGNENHNAPLELRMRVRVHRSRLDHELADGAQTVSSRELELRAQQLLSGLTRHHIAESLREAVRDANSRPRHVISPAVPLARNSVRRCSRQLLGVADMLERQGAVEARGVARASELISNGSGPLYNNRPAQTLGSALEGIAQGLAPEEPID